MRKEKVLIGDMSKESDIKTSLLIDRLTDNESAFLNEIKNSLSALYKNQISFSNTIFYIGIKRKGDIKFLFTFSKPNNVLLFKYPSFSNKKDFKTKEVLSLDNHDKFDILTTIQTILGPTQTVAKEKEHSPTGKVKFLDTVSDEEKDFISSFVRNVKKLFPGLFSFKNSGVNYWIKFKSDKTIAFAFTKNGKRLAFKYRDFKSKHFQLVNIDTLSNEAVDILVDMVRKRVCKNAEDSTSTTIKRKESFVQLNIAQEKFLSTFERIVQEHYKNQFIVIADKQYVAYKVAESDKSIFWFSIDGRDLIFKYRLYGEKTHSLFLITKYDKENLLLTLKCVKKTADSYGIVSNYDKVNNKRILSIYSLINEEMSGNVYAGTPSEKALCRSVKKYLLDVLNNQSSNKYINPIDACLKEDFYMRKLSWGKEHGLESADIVYSYFKAQTIIDKILEYEEDIKQKIVVDQSKFLELLFKNINSTDAVNYASLEFVNKGFEATLKRIIGDTLDNFKAYESN